MTGVTLRRTRQTSITGHYYVDLMDWGVNCGIQPGRDTLVVHDINRRELEPIGRRRGRMTCAGGEPGTRNARLAVRPGPG